MLLDRTDAMTALAQESFLFWAGTAKIDPSIAYGFLGNEYQESRFNVKAIGDKDAAFGCYQLHWHPRGAAIWAGCGIDLRALPSHLDQLKAAWWELSEGAEKHSWAAIQAGMNAAINDPSNNITPAYTAGGLVSKYWLRPKAVTLEVERRGVFATDWQAIGLSQHWANTTGV